MNGTEAAIFRKCAWRLIPFMGLLYVANFLDRSNVSFAALAMNRDIGLSAHAYGIGAGIFFIGYFFFEVPSNLVLERVGARLWMFRIMLSWGLVSMATAFARDALTFSLLRFLLGVCEAGFFPGMILYLTYWFPSRERGHFNALFLTSILIANIIGGPFSGWILSATNGFGGLHNWQWLFVLEGLPSCALAFATLVFLPDRPQSADWLSTEEKRTIEAALSGEETAHGTLRDALADFRIWLLALADIGIITALYGTGLWLPQIVKSLGFSDVRTGFVVAGCNLAAMVGMLIWARRSDRRKERIRHLILPALAAAVALWVTAMLHANIWTVASLTLAMVGIYAALAVLWTLPPAFRGGTAAAAAIALVNSVGNLGGFFGPTLVGYLKDATGNYSFAMECLAAGLAGTCIVVLAIARILPVAAEHSEARQES